MTIKEFVFQGFTTRTHSDALQELFDIADVEQVVLSVAFVSEEGVQAIEAKLEMHAANTTVYAGIRNDITSYQALKRLFSIVQSNLITVDTGARNLVFHPKLYLVCGAAQARLMIGSANLTLGGLNNNIEASLVLDFDLSNSEDRTVIDNVKSLLSTLLEDYPSNIAKVRSDAELDDLLREGRIVDGTVYPAPPPITAAVGVGTADTIPRIKLKSRPLNRSLNKAIATTNSKKSAANIPAVKPPPAGAGVEFELVWESKPLTQRDLSIPDEPGTHKTGSINLDKGLLPDAIDHRHYFREVIFSHLTWTPATTTTEESFAKFHLILKGVSFGEFDLRIGHTIGTDSKAYEQRNAMTRLSWGPAGKDVARPDLIDRTLALYRDTADATRFVIEID